MDAGRVWLLFLRVDRVLSIDHEEHSIGIIRIFLALQLKAYLSAFLRLGDRAVFLDFHFLEFVLTLVLVLDLEIDWRLFEEFADRFASVRLLAWLPLVRQDYGRLGG